MIPMAKPRATVKDALAYVSAQQRRRRSRGFRLGQRELVQLILQGIITLNHRRYNDDAVRGPHWELLE